MCGPVGGGWDGFLRYGASSDRVQGGGKQSDEHKNLLTPKHAEGRLQLAWNPGEGGAELGPIKGEDMLSLDREAVHPVVAMRRETKGVWCLGGGGTAHGQGRTGASGRRTGGYWRGDRREMVFNPAMWMVSPVGEGESKLLLGCSSSTLGKVLRKGSSALAKMQEIWSLDEEKADELVKQIWSVSLAPKLRSFLWLLAQRALPTWERCPEWLLERGVATCGALCSSVPNSLVQILASCRRVEPI